MTPQRPIGWRTYMLLLICLGATTAAAGALAVSEAEKELFAKYVEAKKLKEKGEIARAAKLYEEVVEEAATILDPRSTNVAVLKNDLALLHQGLIRYPEAEKGYREAIQIYEKRGEKNLVLAETLNLAQTLDNLGKLYREMARFSEAEKCHQDSLRIRKTRLGKDALEVAASLNNLGLVYKEMARLNEAKKCLQRALDIHEKHLKKDDPLVATCLHNLANLYWNEGRYKDAKEYFDHALRIRQARLGPDDPLTALTLNSLGWLYLEMSQHQEALSHFHRALQIRQSRLGEDHPDVAESLTGLGVLFREMGRYAEAKPYLQRALQIRRTRLGQDHPSVGESLENRALLYWEMGNYGEAENDLNSALRIVKDKQGKDHPAVATCLELKARLYQDEGKDQDAERLFKEALQIYQVKLPADHPVISKTLDQLAELSWKRGDFENAASLNERCLAILGDNKNVGQKHHLFAQVLNNRGRIVQSQSLAAHLRGHGEKAEALARNAKEEYEKALTIRETRLGKDHPDVAEILGNLAVLDEAMGRTNSAAQHAERARQIIRNHVAHVLPALSAIEQVGFLLRKDRPDWHTALSLALRHPEQLAEASATWLLNGKAVAQQALAQDALLDRARQNPELHKAVGRFEKIRQELVFLSRSADPGEHPEQAKKHMEGLLREQEELANKLGLADGPAWVDLARVRRELPADAVLIDIAHFKVRDFAAGGLQWQPAHYVAWVIPPAGPDKVRLIDLGKAAPIDKAVARVLDELKQAKQRIETEGEPDAEKRLRPLLQELAQLVLHPLLPHIDKTKKERWVISPDAGLWQIPWAALPLPGSLPEWTYAIEKHAICYVVSGRDLIPRPGSMPARTPALVVADPDFDLPLDKAGDLTRALLSELKPDQRVDPPVCRGQGRLGDWVIHVTFSRDGTFVIRDQDEEGEIKGRGTWTLQGATLKGETKTSLYEARIEGDRLTGRRRFKEQTDPATDWVLTLDRPDDLVGRPAGPRLARVGRLEGSANLAEQIRLPLQAYTGDEPKIRTDKEALSLLVQETRSPKVLVLSTHGLFLPPEEIDSQEKKQLEDPLLRCVLGFAGCNNAARAQRGQDNGLLTGRQTVGCDLRGCELVVLAACQTAVGDVQDGEGMAGLRQAFQLAGANSVVATLWQIPDNGSANLLIAFFKNLAAENKNDKTTALCQAQRDVIKARRHEFKNIAHPFYWAAFTITGRPEKPKEKE
jgi:CHAT domain-containing protein/Tfp pilus assembly protein PilF